MPAGSPEMERCGPLRIHAQKGKFAATVMRTKVLVNQLVGGLPGHPQPNLRELGRINQTLRKQWPAEKPV